MKRVLAGMGVLLGLMPIVCAKQRERVFIGELMDSQCAKLGSHGLMTKRVGARDRKECIDDCLKMGGKLMLYETVTGTVYSLRDPEKVREYSGQRVRIVGTRDHDTNVIVVSKVESLP